MKQITINLYAFKELNENAREIAIAEHAEFLDSFPEEFEGENGELLSEYVQHSREDVIDNIEANGYLFFKSGELAHSVQYVAGPNSGKLELKLFGETYLIEQTLV